MVLRTMANTTGWKELKGMIEYMIIENAAYMTGDDLSDNVVRFRAGHSAGLHDVLQKLRHLEQPIPKEDESDGR